MKKNKKTMLIYTIFISLISTSVFAKSCFSCGGTYFPSAIATLVRNLYNLVKLLVPVLIIIMGMVDLLRAVMASDEKKMEEAKPKLIKKLIAGVVIFLIFTIVQFVFKNLLGRNDALSNSLFDCVTYFISEEPFEYACPTRDDDVSDWINDNPNACKGLSLQKCSQTTGCKWNGSDCVKASSNSTSDACKGLSLQTCSQTTGCKWNGSDCVKK